MKEYTVLFSLKPAVRLPREIENVVLNFDEPENPKRIIISKIEEKWSGYTIQSGLRLRVFLKAKNLKNAVEEAKSFADGIISFITLITGVGLDIPTEELAYEITPKIEERDFLQVFYDPIPMPISRRTLNCQLLISLIDKVIKLNPKERDRIGRAMQWYRMGSMTPNIFDKFICFWIGLESLNPIFQEKFSVKDDPTNCPHCGYKWVSTPTVSGLRTFIQTKIPEGKKLYRRIHDLRVNLMHSKKRLDILHKEASDLVPKIAEILFRAICFLLGIAEWDKIPYKKIMEKVPLRIELEATLIGGEASSLGPKGCDPFFEAKHRILTFEQDENKEQATFKLVSDFTAHLNPIVKWRPQEVRMYGDSEVSGSILKTEVKKRGNDQNRSQRIR